MGNGQFSVLSWQFSIRNEVGFYIELTPVPSLRIGDFANSE